MELLQRREDFTIDDIALYQEVMELLQRREDFTNAKSKSLYSNQC